MHPLHWMVSCSWTIHVIKVSSWWTMSAHVVNRARGIDPHRFHLPIIEVFTLVTLCVPSAFANVCIAWWSTLYGTHIYTRVLIHTYIHRYWLYTAHTHMYRRVTALWTRDRMWLPTLRYSSAQTQTLVVHEISLIYT